MKSSKSYTGCKGFKGVVYENKNGASYIKHPKVSITFEDAQFEALNQLAKEKDISFAEAVRRCVSAAIKNRIAKFTKNNATPNSAGQTPA